MKYEKYVDFLHKKVQNRIKQKETNYTGSFIWILHSYHIFNLFKLGKGNKRMSGSRQPLFSVSGSRITLRKETYDYGCNTTVSAVGKRIR